MTISTTQSYVVLQGNDATTVFPYSFPIPIASAVVVTVTVGGVSSILTSAQYTVTGIGSSTGGTVTYNPGAPLATGDSITIQRVLPLVQSASLINQGGYYPRAVEGELDYLTMLIQQQQAQISSLQTTAGLELFGPGGAALIGTADGGTVQSDLDILLGETAYIYVEQYRSSGITDIGTINLALLEMRASILTGLYSLTTLVLSHRFYSLAVSLNLTALGTTQCNIEGNGAVIISTATGTNAVDRTGSRNVTIRNLYVSGAISGGLYPAFGVLDAREDGQGSAAYNKLINVQIKGSFSQAAYLNYGSEQAWLENVQIDNAFDNGGNTALGYGMGAAFDTDNLLGATSDYVTIETGNQSTSFIRSVGLGMKNSSPHGTLLLNGCVGVQIPFAFLRNKGTVNPQTVVCCLGGVNADLSGFNLDSSSAASIPNYFIDLQPPSGLSVSSGAGTMNHCRVSTGANGKVGLAFYNFGASTNPKLKNHYHNGILLDVSNNPIQTFNVDVGVSATSEISGEFWVEEAPATLENIGVLDADIYCVASTQVTFDTTTLSTGSARLTVHTKTGDQQIVSASQVSLTTSKTATIPHNSSRLPLSRGTTDNGNGAEFDNALQTIAFTGGGSPVGPGYRITAVPNNSTRNQLIIPGGSIAVPANMFTRLCQVPSIQRTNGRSAGQIIGVVDPGNLADGAGETDTLTLANAGIIISSGAGTSTPMLASFGIDLNGTLLTAYPSASNIAAARFVNFSGGAQDLASSGLKFLALGAGDIEISGSAVYNPGSLAAGATNFTQDITVTGAALGDHFEVAFSRDLQGLTWIGYGTGADTVRILEFNSTSGAVDLASGTAFAYKLKDFSDNKATKIFDLPNLVSGATTSFDVPVTGCVLQDFATVGMGVSAAGLIVWPYVSAAGNVKIFAKNPTAGPIDLASTAYNVRTYRAINFVDRTTVDLVLNSNSSTYGIV